MLCAIWFNLYNLKNVKITHGGVLLLVKLQLKLVKFFNLNYAFERWFIYNILHTNFTPWKLFYNGRQSVKKVQIRVTLVRVFLHSDWIGRDTEYLSLLSPNVGNADQNNSEYGHFTRSDDPSKP